MADDLIERSAASKALTDAADRYDAMASADTPAINPEQKRLLHFAATTLRGAVVYIELIPQRTVFQAR